MFMFALTFFSQSLIVLELKEPKVVNVPKLWTAVHDTDERLKLTKSLSISLFSLSFVGVSIFCEWFEKDLSCFCFPFPRKHWQCRTLWDHERIKELPSTLVFSNVYQSPIVAFFDDWHQVRGRELDVIVGAKTWDPTLTWWQAPRRGHKLDM